MIIEPNVCHFGDALEVLRAFPDQCVQTCVTSPPYWGLRDYGTATWSGGDPACDHKVRNDPRVESSMLGGGKGSTGHQQEGFAGACPRCGAVRIDSQIGVETSPQEYIDKLVAVFREVRRVLKDDGTLWLNLGDSYANDGKWGGSSGGKHVKELHGNSGIGRGKTHTGLKPKDLVGIPWMAAFALRADGWYLRSDIILAKPNPMPESVTDRPTKSHEYLFLLSKSERYFYDTEAIKEPVADSQQGRIRSDVIGGNKGDQVHHSPGGVYSKGPAQSFTGPKSLELHPDRSVAPRGKAGKNAMRGQGSNRDTDGGHANREDRDMNAVGAGEVRNKRSVWTVATTPYSGAHFATFPPNLIKPCILAGSAPGDIVLDPFFGSGTTGEVAQLLGRDWLGIELNESNRELQHARTMRMSLGI